MISQIGFYCPKITKQESHINIVNVLNELSDGYTNTILFNTSFELPIANRKFCILPSLGAKYFYGVLFCFDIDSLNLINSFPGPSHKFLVTDDIFWQNKQTPATLWSQILDSQTSIITLNQKTYDLYDICFKTPTLNMNNGFNLQECKDVLQTI